MGRAHFLARALEELGLASLYRAPRDVKLLCLQRFVRLFAYGASTLVLVAYLQALGISRTRVGAFMTLTLAGDIAISFALTLVADAVGRKAVLALGAALMAASGAAFAVSGSYWVLLAAAVLGVISPSGNEIGPFRAVEESIVAHLTLPAHRGDVYAWYSLLGTAGTAFGMVTCGWVVHHLLEGLGWGLVDAYRVVFVAYAALGAVKLALAVALSDAVETEKDATIVAAATAAAAPSRAGRGDRGGTGVEAAPLLEDDGNGEEGDGNDSSGSGSGSGSETETEGDTEERAKLEKGGRGGRLRALLPKISRESVNVMISLCFLFALDSFASGLAPLSWVTYFFRSQYNLEEGKLGTVFFVTSIIAACSVIVASSLAKRFGNVNTMVFTHLPSAIFLALIPIPNEVHWSLLFLVLRSCSQSMDVAPRSAFLAAIVLPRERTAIMGLVNVVKTAAQSLGPLITGVLADRGMFWVSFVCAGALKASYDVGLLLVFKNHERERADRERAEEERRAEAEAEVEAEREGGGDGMVDEEEARAEGR